MATIPTSRAGEPLLRSGPARATSLGKMNSSAAKASASGAAWERRRWRTVGTEAWAASVGSAIVDTGLLGRGAERGGPGQSRHRLWLIDVSMASLDVVPPGSSRIRPPAPAPAPGGPPVDLLGVMRACLRRWYVFLPIVLLTAWLARDQYQQAQPQYTATASVVIAPSTELFYNRGRQTETGLVVTTPFNGSEGPRVLAGLLARALNTATVRQQLLPAGGAALTATRNVQEDSTVVNLQVVAADAGTDAEALEAVRAGANGRPGEDPVRRGRPRGPAVQRGQRRPGGPRPWSPTPTGCAAWSPSPWRACSSRWCSAWSPSR